MEFSSLSLNHSQTVIKLPQDTLKFLFEIKIAFRTHINLLCVCAHMERKEIGVLALVNYSGVKI